MDMARDDRVDFALRDLARGLGAQAVPMSRESTSS
jgi:hypothetical protein